MFARLRGARIRTSSSSASAMAWMLDVGGFPLAQSQPHGACAGTGERMALVSRAAGVVKGAEASVGWRAGNCFDLAVASPTPPLRPEAACGAPLVTGEALAVRAARGTGVTAGSILTSW